MRFAFCFTTSAAAAPYAMPPMRCFAAAGAIAMLAFRAATLLYFCRSPDGEPLFTAITPLILHHFSR